MDEISHDEESMRILVDVGVVDFMEIDDAEDDDKNDDRTGHVFPGNLPMGKVGDGVEAAQGQI